MAKGQKHSNREVRKPKKDAPSKTIAAGNPGSGSSAKKR